MSSYSFDADRRELLVTHDECGALRSSLVTTLDPDAAEAGPAIAEILTELSTHVWDAYSSENELHLYRGSAGPALDTLVAALPVLADQFADYLTRPSLEVAWPTTMHAAVLLAELGDLLADVGLAADQALVAEVRVELDAVAAARDGNFAGRGSQAAGLSRPMVLDAHLDVADNYFVHTMTPTTEDLAHLDPTSACLAATWQLWAATRVAGHFLAVAPEVVLTLAVVRLSDLASGSGPLARTEMASQLLGLMEAGTDPRPAIIEAIFDAQQLQLGCVRKIPATIAQLTERLALGRHLAATLENVGARIGNLDPAHPASDLLEDLVLAINGAWKAFQAGLPSDGGPGGLETAAEIYHGLVCVARSALAQEYPFLGVSRSEPVSV